MDILEFKLSHKDEEFTFRLQPLKRKDCMRLTHRFLGAVQGVNGNISLIDIDLLEDFAKKLFSQGFVQIGVEQIELTNLDWFHNYLKVFYLAIAQAVTVNNPTLF